MKKIFLSISIFILFIILSPIASAATPAVFFSDLTDGTVTGWNGGNQKGAAVSIWGYGFGSSRGSSYVTVGGVNLTDNSDYAEWGATTNPTTARDLQRITFWLKPSMTLGDTTITVTTTEGTSAPIPFYTRNTGNIYFVSPSGNNSNTGLNDTTQAWATLEKPRATMVAGDVVYVRGGTYLTPDSTSSGNHTCYVNFYNQNHAAGTLHNSISVAGYPSELAVFGDGTDSVNKFIRQVGYTPNDHMDYWTFAKLKVQIYNSVLGIATGSHSTANYLRIVGMDETTTVAHTGTGICNWFTGNDGMVDTVFVGNYVHHTGKPLDWQPGDGDGYRVGT